LNGIDSLFQVETIKFDPRHQVDNLPLHDIRFGFPIFNEDLCWLSLTHNIDKTILNLLQVGDTLRDVHELTEVVVYCFG
jgi:hypothetical protein